MLRMTPNMIRTIRADLGMTQEQFAERQSVSYSLVTKWERGARKPTGGNLVLLCGAWIGYQKRVATRAKAGHKARKKA